MINVAVIGMSCRFPGANNLELFWDNLVKGIETIHRFTKEELQAAGISDELLNDPRYIRAKGILDDIERFDANFFGYNPNDARITDPQQRMFFECAWEALEAAGCIPEKYEGLIGVYASMADSLYLQNNLLKNKNCSETLDWFQTRIGTSVTTLSTQLSYRLNLQGPSINITTACSSSIVAIATACRGLIDYDCDVAIAGASAIAVPQKSGYLFQEDGIESSDGHCRAFDADAKGTVFSNGVGVVILKRLEDAIQDGDPIQAVIKGWSINNDGSEKAGFTAPSVIGQAKCITSAFDFSEIHSDSLSYLEAHGTGTMLGDVIELNALEEAFKLQTSKKQFCAIGSVKTNIGHTDIAAGMASFIKTVLALKNKIIPPTLHYQKPNPKINFPNTPFFVNSELKKWDFGAFPRRAGVNSSGIGGTNAFLILEEFKEFETENNNRPFQLLLLSAKTKPALEKITTNLTQKLQTINTPNLADIAFTLQVGRADFNYRRMLVSKNADEALLQLKNLPLDSIFNRHHTTVPKVVFMFSGQGTQYIGMGQALYGLEPVFTEWIDHCCDLLEQDLKHAVHSLIFQSLKNDEETHDTAVIQPALFIVEYSLAKLLMSLGIKPDAMIGHSVGEYVAACLAEVMTLENALRLICYRGRLMATSSPGMMLAVHMAENELLEFLGSEKISIATINSSTSCVISGELKTICDVEEKLKKIGIVSHRLRTSHAFHSHMMDPILDDFRRILETVDLQAPNIRFISNVTGNWINAEEATSPDYWTHHLRHTVKFSAGLKTLVNDGTNIFIEVGPGKTLCRFVQELVKKDSGICVTNTLPTSNEEVSFGEKSLLLALGQLWLHGVKINWVNYDKRAKRKKLVLPTYPFERRVYWIDPDNKESNQNIYKKQPYPKWFYEPSWIRTSLSDSKSFSENVLVDPSCWVLLLDNEGSGDNIARILLQHQQVVITVKQGSDFAILNNQECMINITKKEDYQKLVMMLCKITNLPLKVINLFALTSEHSIDNLDLSEVQKTLYLCFYSSLFLAQALIEQQYEQQINILAVGNEIYSVVGSEKVYPAKSTVTGPCRVIPQEHPNFKMRVLDVVLSEIQDKHRDFICKQIISTLLEEHDSAENIVAYRGQFRWTQVFQPLKCKESCFTLRPEGVYLLMGGLGGISLTIAKLIAQSSKNPKLILISRSQFPKQADWKIWLAEHGEKNSTSKKILHLEKIKNLGAQITIMQSNVADFEHLKLTVENIRENFGRINGVIHAAGIAGGGLVQLKTVEMANKILVPKIDGTYILTYLLRDEPLDFFVLCSSVSAIIGELSQVDYCAANACLDAFGYTTAFSKTPLTVINWNTWREIGMAVETDRPEDVTYFDRNNDISPEEGARIFADVLGNNYKQTIVSTFDINAYISLMNKNKEVNAQIAVERQEILGDEAEINYVPPTNDIELALVNIWQDILGVERIGVLDDFFELGGHSLMALRMLTKIQEKLNIKISLQILQETKVIQALAKKIQSLSKKHEFSPLLIPIRTEGHQPPLFCLHPVGGTVFCYLPLAKHLKFECPIYGLQDPSFEYGKSMFKTLEQMATCYIEAIQKIQAQGPYLLCGLSFGATLVVEIAKQLRAKGEKLKPLILFDGWAKFSDHQHIEEIFKESILHENKSHVFVDQTFVELSWQRMKLLLNYEILEIQDKMILFKAKELLPEYKQIAHPQNYWNNYTQNSIETYVIPGNHDTMLEEPNVLILAKKLDFILEALESKLILEKDLS